MMANCFRSDSVQGFSSWDLASNQTPVPGLSSEKDPLLFYSPDYEQSLMDEYLPNSQTRSEFMSSSDYSESTAPSSDFTPSYSSELTPQLDYDTDFLDIPYEAKEIKRSPSSSPSPPPERKPKHVATRVPRRPARYASPIEVQGGDLRKRGRPSGSKSNSKMAVYAKQYREMKKNETRTLSDEVSRLSNVNDRLQSENDRLSREVKILRKANSINEQLATLVETLRTNPGRFRLCIDCNGSPYLEVV
ncbi:hypothetical protein PRIPAC_89332 [Pristionchus pacificus]|uniref:BZIP domain-containing protein n=1 Tax=Pristionchus pacificus TaxID=54126 RepID=A0A2A6BYY4_PRIPA|nr:hypothetical protein PRIPAC_89332 [Pristionchus pacificus]|eukprot:PDM71212.1 hypothetical protein PRIPAC_43595 [Pristionchus pacificus]